MPNDRVSIDYTVTGTDAAARNVESVTKAVEKTGDAAKDTTAALTEASQGIDNLSASSAEANKTAEGLGTTINDVGTGVSGLNDVMSLLNPTMGVMASEMRSGGLAGQAASVGIRSASTAVRAFATNLASPAILGSVAVFGAITIAIRAIKSAQDEANAATQRGIELVRQRNEIESSRRGGLSNLSGELIRNAEVALASKGLPSGSAFGVVDSAVNAAGDAIVSPTAAVNEAIRSISETGKIPSREEIARRVAVRQLRISGVDPAALPTSQIDALSRTGNVQDLLNARAASLANSETQAFLASESAKFSAAVESRTVRGRDAQQAEDTLNKNAADSDAIGTTISGKLTQIKSLESRLEDERSAYNLRPQAGEARRLANEIASLRSEIRELEQRRNALQDETAIAEVVLRGDAEYDPGTRIVNTPTGQTSEAAVRFDRATGRGGTVHNHFYGTAYLNGDGSLGVSPHRVRD
ncbi:MAG TPA: hypothetical protein PK093_24845 [Phycisphaerae bacterium]|nr:hypothetical protein [Phycisphaerae bacterium]